MWVSTYDQLYSKKTIDKKNAALEQKMDQLHSDVRESVTAALKGLPAQLFTSEVQERLMNTLAARLEATIKAQEERLRTELLAEEERLHTELLAEIERRLPTAPASHR